MSDRLSTILCRIRKASYTETTKDDGIRCVTSRLHGLAKHVKRKSVRWTPIQRWCTRAANCPDHLSRTFPIDNFPVSKSYRDSRINARRPGETPATLMSTLNVRTRNAARWKKKSWNRCCAFAIERLVAANAMRRSWASLVDCEPSRCSGRLLLPCIKMVASTVAERFIQNHGWVAWCASISDIFTGPSERL